MTKYFAWHPDHDHHSTLSQHELWGHQRLHVSLVHQQLLKSKLSYTWTAREMSLLFCRFFSWFSSKISSHGVGSYSCLVILRKRILWTRVRHDSDSVSSSEKGRQVNQKRLTTTKILEKIEISSEMCKESTFPSSTETCDTYNILISFRLMLSNKIDSEVRQESRPRSLFYRRSQTYSLMTISRMLFVYFFIITCIIVWHHPNNVSINLFTFEWNPSTCRWE